MKEHKFSRKRLAVLEKIRSTDKHPSAEWVYSELKSEIPELSLGTVYRNISAFKNRGEISSVGVVNGQERFDGNTDEHAHFICQGCGAVMDVDSSSGDDLSKISERYGVKIIRRSLTYYGLCGKCVTGGIPAYTHPALKP